MNKSVILFTIFSLSHLCLRAGEMETLIQFDKSEFNFELNDCSVEISCFNNQYGYPDAERVFPCKFVKVIVPGIVTFQSMNYQVVEKELLYSDVSMSSVPTEVQTNMLVDSELELDNINKVSLNGYDDPTGYVTSLNGEKTTLFYFNVSPFEYDSENQKLYFRKTVSLSFTYVTGSKPVVSDRYAPELQEGMSLLANAVDLRDLGQTSDGIYYEEGYVISNESKSVDYAIITSQDLADSFLPLIRCKMMKGLRAKIYTVEQIDRQFNGDDLQEKIKRQIYSLKSLGGLNYVLLGGDDTVVPVRLCSCSAAGRTSYIPADNYYVSFRGNFKWDANGNGIFGELDDEVNFSSDIFIGRIPVRTNNQVAAFLTKIVRYELEGLKDFAIDKGILMCGTNLFNSSGTFEQSDAYNKAERLYSNYIEPYWDGERYRFFDTYTDFETGADYDLTADNLQTELSRGYAFMDMMTHGSQTSWMMEKGTPYTATQGAALNNKSFMVVTTMACSTNAFDAKIDPCLSESLIRGEGSRVIAYLGSSREGWGVKGNSLGTSLNYESVFYENLFNPEVRFKNFGKLVWTAKQSFISACNSANTYRWIQFALNPIGDPEMYIYTGKPKKIQNPTVFFYKNKLCVESGISGCDITVMSVNDDGQSYFQSVKNTSVGMFENTSSFNLEEKQNGIYICITKPGYAPLWGTVKTITGQVKPVSEEMLMATLYESSKICSFESRFSNLLTCEINVSNESSSAELYLMDIMGNTLQSLSVGSKGLSTLSFYGLKSGTYILALCVDGAVVDTKRFVKE